jgi:diguanylate cyclase (GGDEF)-like protein
MVDTLTKLQNRNALNQRIKELDNISLILINIDTFSQVNDFYGHNLGDRVLAKFANKLQNTCIDKDSYLFRVSGDEFVILISNVESHNVVLRAQEISKKINSYKYEVYNESVSLNTTISISFEEKSKLLMTADMALKVARRESKNLIVYDKTMSLNKEYENNMLWTKKIKKAIKEDKIILYFQAIIDNNNTQEIKKYESLIRLIDEDDKVITPYFFLDIAKKSKLYKQLTKIVIQKSFETFRSNNAEFSINLSIDDILDRDIYNYILEMLDIYHVSNRVIFEIVESESIENFEEIQKFITRVKSIGCRIAIDDFGTGYSNFEYLMRLEPDFIKIDGSIIKEILTDKNSEIITSVIVDFAKKMDIKIIAEFVENEEIFKKVKELGIDYSQGYYFSKPKVNLI